SLEFHEIGGLVVCGLFVFHNLLNRRWIAAISGRLFGRTLAPRTRLGYVVDMLLLFCMVFIAVSGAMISKTILTGISGTWIGWKPGHYFVSAAALMLIGVHIGLHWSFIRTTFAKLLRLPRMVARPLGIVCLAAVLIYGGYSLVTSSFTGWLAEPFEVLSGASVEVTGGGGGGGQGSGLHGAGETGSPAEALGVVATYGSIAAVFAALTVLVERLLKRTRRPRPAPEHNPA
ncbi:MAG: DUF4405 domain-containing protein, partial [Dehalococcoidia bacterium]|nr:DUF4405 domain-containing protein [Dehalococcoidia bacterium]